MPAIEMRIDSLPQLFDSLDPAPFHDRALDREAEAWLRESVDEVPSREPLELVVRGGRRRCAGACRRSRRRCMRISAARSNTRSGSCGGGCGSAAWPC